MTDNQQVVDGLAKIDHALGTALAESRAIGHIESPYWSVELDQLDRRIQSLRSDVRRATQKAQSTTNDTMEEDVTN